MADKSKRSGERSGTEAEARRVLAAWNASGLSQRAFAFREGLLPAATLLVDETSRSSPDEPASQRDRHALRARRRHGTADAPRPLAPVTIRIGAKTAMEIDPSGVSASWVAAVMTVLERIGCS
jgi:hypothetical protein